jgi:hypothetical protein
MINNSRHIASTRVRNKQQQITEKFRSNCSILQSGHRVQEQTRAMVSWAIWVATRPERQKLWWLMTILDKDSRSRHGIVPLTDAEKV